MSKREASQIAAAAGVDIDAPRAKRRKEAPADSKPLAGTSNADGVKKEGESSEPKRDGPEVIKEKGLRLWTTVKDAVDKDGRPLCVDFMRLPSKRQYPDYYVQIKKPIALDDIKAQLDALAYASFEDAKHDLETCFRNAKRYNIRESQIFQDAKVLHKLVKKEYAKMTGTAEEAAEDEGDERTGDGAAHEGGSDDEGAKKKKPPNMNRLLKTRLQKLVEKTDDSGRVLSTEFMELPNKKQWPIYYKMIKRPQCLESIFKRLKRKEYHTSQEFANDVELVFSNALEFNQDHTEIWEDAVVLRDYFRHLMSDLPPPHTIPAYTITESHTKIKLKVPAHHPPAASTPAQPSPVPGTLKIRAPHPIANGAASQASPPGEPSRSPAVPVKPVPASASPPLPQPGQAPSHPIIPAPIPAVAQLKASASGSNVAPNAYPQPGYSPYPQYTLPAYQQSGTPAPAPSVSPAQVAVPPTTTVAELQSPFDAQRHRTPKCVTLLTKPLGRLLQLDYTDGVRTWAVRLCGETSVHVSGVRFLKLDHEDEESSDDEEKLQKPEEEEEEENGEEKVKEKEEEEPKPEKRKRGRPPKKKKQLVVEEAKIEESAKKKGKARAKQPPGETQVKLNGAVVNALDDNKSEWDLELPIGPNLVEIGEKGGTPWRVYLDRMPV
ncbi:Bromodomain-containing protein [Rhodofomes roseus]|uniref:Bromodomain-containing protein n=1 Tax=Rhodofomes roseus TaxID=34475 RepID=A0ABQ8JYU4_9APHY|nr:Bromodomain-containing protein [Rhodofomes roseus]KAH9829449.1 Bromodomain-containing protein [Rhodofomes roseus]